MRASKNTPLNRIAEALEKIAEQGNRVPTTESSTTIQRDYIDFNWNQTAIILFFGMLKKAGGITEEFDMGLFLEKHIRWFNRKTNRYENFKKQNARSTLAQLTKGTRYIDSPAKAIRESMLNVISAANQIIEELAKE